jgi:hypothetical protein
MLAALFSAFGRELTEVDVDAWHLVLGDLPREELSTAILHAARTRESLPHASVIRRAVFEARSWNKRNRSGILSNSLRIASAVKDYRAANPGVTADQVADFVSQLEQQISSQ